MELHPALWYFLGAVTWSAVYFSLEINGVADLDDEMFVAFSVGAMLWPIAFVVLMVWGIAWSMTSHYDRLQQGSRLHRPGRW